MSRRDVRFLGCLLVCATLSVACDSTTFEVVPVASLELSASAAQVSVGDTARIEALAFGPDGSALGNHPISWTSSNATVAQVDGGLISALARGSSQVTATSAGVSASMQIAATAPVVALTPASVLLEVVAGGAASQSLVTIHNGGEEVLEGIVATVRSETAGVGGLGVAVASVGWLQADLSQAVGPATLTVTGSPTGLPPGTYSGWVDVSADDTDMVSLPVSMLVGDPGSQAVVLSRSSVAFQVAQNADPPPEFVQITSPEGGSLRTGLMPTVEYPTEEAPDWVVATVSAESTPSTLTIQANTTGVLPGEYNATIRVDADEADPAFLLVTMQVLDATRPVLEVSPSSVHLATSTLTPSASAQSQVTSKTIAAAQVSASVTYADPSATGWLTASLTATGTPSTLTLSAETAALLPGDYTATVTVAAADADPVQVDVSVSVAVLPVIVVTPATVVLTAALGLDPVPAVLVVANAAVGDLAGLTTEISYEPGRPSGWLTADLAASTAPTTLALGAASSGLLAGTYSATVTVSGNGAVAATVQVTFVVTGGPLIGLTPTSVSFSAEVGGAAPSPVNVVVANLGVGILSGLSVSVGYKAGEPTGWLTGSLLLSIAPTVATVSVSAGGLAAGTYHATLLFESPLAFQQTLDVTLVVSDP